MIAMRDGKPVQMCPICGKILASHAAVKKHEYEQHAKRREEQRA